MTECMSFPWFSKSSLSMKEKISLYGQFAYNTLICNNSHKTNCMRSYKVKVKVRLSNLYFVVLLFLDHKKATCLVHEIVFFRFYFTWIGFCPVQSAWPELHWFGMLNRLISKGEKSQIYMLNLSWFVCICVHCVHLTVVCLYLFSPFHRVLR